MLSPFRRPSRPERQGSEPSAALPKPPRPVANDVEAEGQSVAVVHDHLFGNCAGRLVAGPDGIRYVTAHKDAFTMGFAEMSSIIIDVERRRVRITVPRGRVYNFRTSDDREALIALEAALQAR